MNEKELKDLNEANKYLVAAIQKLRKLYNDPESSKEFIHRTAGLSLCLSHLIDIVKMNNHLILGKLANNLEYMKAEIQHEEEKVLVKSIPNTTLQDGGNLPH